MSMNAALEIIQKKSAARRLKSFRDIFDKLKGREFSVEDVAAAIGMSYSGTRRYRRELLEAGLMHDTGKGRGNCASYLLTTDQAAIDSFLALVESGGRAVEVLRFGQQGTKRKAKEDNPDFKRPPTPIVAFRHWLDIALFGDGPAPSLAVAS